jgi:hypothetical protein
MRNVSSLFVRRKRRKIDFSVLGEELAEREPLVHFCAGRPVITAGQSFRKNEARSFQPCRKVSNLAKKPLLANGDCALLCIFFRMPCWCTIEATPWRRIGHPVSEYRLLPSAHSPPVMVSRVAAEVPIRALPPHQVRGDFVDNLNLLSDLEGHRFLGNGRLF